MCEHLYVCVPVCVRAPMCVCTPVCVYTPVCVCAFVCARAPVRVRAKGPAFPKNTLGACLLAPCASRRAHAVGAASLGFHRTPGLTCGQALHHNSGTCFILALGTHRNRFERQHETDGEGEVQELGEGRKGNNSEESCGTGSPGQSIPA